jgi:Zn-dependent protease with chaperone function
MASGMNVASKTAAGWRVVPGPVDRESFFDAQRRHRRAARAFTLLVLLALALVGLPLAGILFPLLFGLASIGLDILSLILPLPDLMGAFLATGGHFGEGPNWLLEWLVIGLVVGLPGIAAMLLAWGAVWAVFLDAGMAGLAARLGARPPRAGDLEERQLVNLVEEMAIAAGRRPPAVLLLDSPLLNAAALGPDPDEATVLVSRGLLDACDRDETQGVIAHLIAFIGNGDQRVALLLVSLAATMGLVRQLLQAPFSPQARALLAELARFARAPRGQADAAAEARLIEALLAADDPAAVEAATQGRLRPYLMLPFMMASAMFNLVGFLTSLLFLSPALALLLRRRRYLADATAVQLTRQPDGLAQALAHLASQPAAALPGGAEVGLLFVVAPRLDEGRRGRPLGLQFEIHPPIGKRHARLGALGALLLAPDAPARPALSGRQRLVIGLLGALLVPLFGLLLYLMLFLILAGTMLALMVGMMAVLLVAGPINMVLR